MLLLRPLRALRSCGAWWIQIDYPAFSSMNRISSALHRTEMNPTLVIVAAIFGAVVLVAVFAMVLN